jgi:hypothetical protein
MPPFAGFIVKFAVFAAAVKSGQIWLAFVGILNSIVGVILLPDCAQGGLPVSLDDESKPMPVTSSIPQPSFCLWWNYSHRYGIRPGSAFRIRQPPPSFNRL